jgi:hypothetical protein
VIISSLADQRSEIATPLEELQRVLEAVLHHEVVPIDLVERG